MITAEPVIVVHLDTAKDAHLTACTGEEFAYVDDSNSPKTPRVLCTGCQMAAINGRSYHLPGTITTVIIMPDQVIINHKRERK